VTRDEHDFMNLLFELLVETTAEVQALKERVMGQTPPITKEMKEHARANTAARCVLRAKEDRITGGELGARALRVLDRVW